MYKNYLGVIPRILSVLRLNNSVAISINVDITIKHVATAIIVGLSCSRSPVHIWRGIVVRDLSPPATNRITTISSNDVTNANKAPEIIPGKIKGRVILKNVFVGVLPKLDAARVILSSKPLSVAVTVMTTNGVPRIMWAIIIPGKVAAKPTFANEKKIADPEMIKGIIIGEINTLIINCL